MGGHRKIGRPKLRWSDVIRKHMKVKQVKIEEAQERKTWRLKTRCADPGIGGRRCATFDRVPHSGPCCARMQTDHVD